MNVIELRNLSKNYGRKAVVEDFSLSLEKGHICGLIGPNGAGKTTIMKMMAGLAAQTKGEIAFFGKSDNLDQSRNRMAFMLEAPILDKSMNARQNMEYVRYVKGVADKKKIDEMLDFVGLHDVGKKKAGKFSLGMTQRLGIAMALLTEPEIMVLDEPVNGLDPEGIVEIRLMLKKLAEEKNVTIIISSHILSELSELCTDFSIINHGRQLENLSREELMAKCRSYYAIRTNDINRTAAVIEDKLGTKQYKVIHGDEIRLFDFLDNVEKVSKTITDNGLILTKFISEGESLEEFYLSKVGAENE
ncbi:MAG: ATP-binding cassette domain-containing protein [Ruminococcus sp.]|nr:ATP-binding cassette domain-containing protein [Ruminococcus sp.]